MAHLELNKGKNHYTDCSNASRTMLYNILIAVDKDIMSWLIYQALCCQKSRIVLMITVTLREDIIGAKIPILSVAGDQQAALFGQACFSPGMVKNTYGTGCFIVMNTGDKPVVSKNNLLTTIAWSIDGKISYALEGSIFMGGATIQWLRDELKIIKSAPESEALALKVPDNGGVYMVPAFTGLGAPWWDMYARGTILGMSRGSNNCHIARAALEAIAYQSRDVMEAMQEDADICIPMIKVDGGASANNLLMQFQSDILNTKVARPACIETTALGVAYLAGLRAGIFDCLDAITADYHIDKVFNPEMDKDIRKEKYDKWIKAVECARSFTKQ